VQADWQEKDLYSVLSVEQDADAKAIGRAYRKLARQLHPDTHPDDAEATERFKEVTAAYDVLGDPIKRAEYDEFRLASRMRRPGKVIAVHGWKVVSPTGPLRQRGLLRRRPWRMAGVRRDQRWRFDPDDLDGLLGSLLGGGGRSGAPLGEARTWKRS